MVVLVDLDDEAPSLHSPHAPGSTRFVKPVHHSLAPPAVVADSGDSVWETAERPNPNILSGFAAALSCYP
jgi:hypothetical protein